jgi:hypothetical protein
MPQRVIARETPDALEIERVTYLPLRKDLWVYFRNGAVTVYVGVDAEMWDAFETTDSRDAFVHGLTTGTVLVAAKKKPD